MDLASLLLRPAGKKSGALAIDQELDALFQSSSIATSKPSASAALLAPTSPDKIAQKRKLGHADDAEKLSKRAKAESAPENSRDAESTAVKQPNLSKSGKKHSSPEIKIKKKRKSAVVEINESREDDSDEDDNADLEDAYLAGRTDGKKKTAEEEEEAASDAESSSSGGEPSQIVHESLSKRIRTKSAKTKYVPTNEAPELRDARTIFVGNLSVKVAQQKSLLKQLHRHILTQVPTAKIESTRFRSIPFQKPTTKLPTSDDEGASKADTASTKQPRAHDRERTSTWREQRADDDSDGKSDDKKFLNSKQKKKIAFIHQEFHPEADTANAYIVFAHPPPPAPDRPSNLPPPTAKMDPYEAARLAAEKCDGTLFMERMIRVDLVRKRTPAGDRSSVGADPKLSIFVGNLDFASKEEDLRVFFEGVVSAERGPPGADGNAEKAWVTRVRIVRDRETQLGKGFAYIQFADRECVDEMLALEATKLKFAKRTLRVQRCKTLPGASSSSTPKFPPGASAKLHPSSRPSARPAPVKIPKGDPTLGAKLAHLPKAERKEYKSSDADRVARRLAKKKARIALGNAGVKVQGKERDRVRKSTVSGKAAPAKKKERKERVRSEKSLSKRNAKK